MYRVAPMPPVPPTPEPFQSKILFGAVDQERQLVVWMIANDTRDYGLGGWLFQKDGILVPFDVRENTVGDWDHMVREMRLLDFGFSRKVRGAIGLDGYQFRDSEHQREWALLAVEGVLVAQTRPLGGVLARTSQWEVPRMTAYDTTYTLPDFGYAEEPHRDDA